MAFTRQQFKATCLTWRNMINAGVPLELVRDYVNDHTDYNLSLLRDTDATATTALRTLRDAQKRNATELRNVLISMSTAL